MFKYEKLEKLEPFLLQCTAVVKKTCKMTWNGLHTVACEHTRKKQMSFFAGFHTVWSVISFHFRTIMNCNLKSIQPRAFAQNPHLSTMWVNTPSLRPCFLCHEKIYYVMWRLTACSRLYGCRWLSVKQQMMQLIEVGFRKIVALPLLSQLLHILNETSIICFG